MMGSLRRVNVVPSVDQARPMEEVFEAFWARYSRKIVSLRTMAVGLYKNADSQLFEGLGVRMGLPGYLLNGRMGKMGSV